MEKQWHLAQLLADIATDPPTSDVCVTGLAIDSREVCPGTLFLAYQGHTHDGKQYLSQAIAQGAAAICVDQPIDIALSVPCIVMPNLQHKVGEIAAKFYDYPSNQMTVIGVTGTNGKSSVCYFLAQAFAALGQTCAIMSTVGQGIWPNLTDMPLTTLGGLALQQSLAKFADQQVAVVVLEVSSHALDQGRVQGVAFDYAVFTHISRDHLDYHLTMEAYANCKQQLFCWPTLKGIVLNEDDAYARAWQQQAGMTAEAYRYSLIRSNVDLYLEAFTLTDLGSRVQVRNAQQRGTWKNNLLGRFNIENTLAVVALLRLMHYPLSACEPVLSALQAPPGRMEFFRVNGQPTVVIDYAHTADALAQTLVALRPLCRGRLYCLLGCGGNRDRGKRPLMAAVAEQQADRIIVCDDNPRFEPSNAIISDILTGFQQPKQVRVIPNRREAIAWAIAEASPEDIVLLAGKGHERYQEIAGQRHPFNERQVVADCFRSRACLV